jgi:hypothetical protein
VETMSDTSRPTPSTRLRWLGFLGFLGFEYPAFFAFVLFFGIRLGPIRH